MTTTSRNPNIFDSEVHRIRTPNGTLFAIFVENPDGSINSVQLTIGKAGNDVSPWATAVAELMNFMIAKGVTLEELITCLSHMTSGREARTINSVCRSGPEGIWMALIRYKRSKFEALNKTLGISEHQDYKGPSVAPWARTREH